MEKFRQRLLIGLLAGYALVFSIWSALSPAGDMSWSERRLLNQRPVLTLANVASGFYMSRFEPYLQDQFPLRDNLRRLKALVSSKLLRQSDQHGIYLYQGIAGKLEEPLDPAGIRRKAALFSDLIRTQLSASAGRIWFALIPDKAQYLASDAGVPSVSHQDLADLLRQELSGCTVLDLKDQLTLEHFYRTDLHWRQEMLPDLAMDLARQMGTELSGAWRTETLDAPFHGVYQSQSALAMEPDTLRCLTNEILSGVRVYDHETSRWSSLYDPAAAGGPDPYSLFLSGPKPLLTLENPASPNNRELLVFRDSFGSSLVPLLAEGYARITVIDLRYLAASRLDQLVSFHGHDVLFLYSAQVLNEGNFLP